MATSAPAGDASSSPPAPQPQAEPARKAVRVVVKGRVTGVGFRDWTASTAESLGLAGWVRNRRDGSVEALLSGDPAKIEDMITRRLPPEPCCSNAWGASLAPLRTASAWRSAWPPVEPRTRAHEEPQPPCVLQGAAVGRPRSHRRTGPHAA